LLWRTLIDKLLLSFLSSALPNYFFEAKCSANLLLKFIASSYYILGYLFFLFLRLFFFSKDLIS
jgi:hypothetical protein